MILFVLFAFIGIARDKRVCCIRMVEDLKSTICLTLFVYFESSRITEHCHCESELGSDAVHSLAPSLAILLLSDFFVLRRITHITRHKLMCHAICTVYFWLGVMLGSTTATLNVRRHFRFDHVLNRN